MHAVKLDPGMKSADRKSTRLNSSHLKLSRMPSSAWKKNFTNFLYIYLASRKSKKTNQTKGLKKFLLFTKWENKNSQELYVLVFFFSMSYKFDVCNHAGICNTDFKLKSAVYQHVSLCVKFDKTKFVPRVVHILRSRIGFQKRLISSCT